MYCTFKLPYAIRLNNHNEYTALKTTLVADNIVINKLSWKIPVKIKNSPIKLHVPGNAAFANINIKKIGINKGIV